MALSADEASEEVAAAHADEVVPADAEDGQVAVADETVEAVFERRNVPDGKRRRAPGSGLSTEALPEDNSGCDRGGSGQQHCTPGSIVIVCLQHISV